MAHQNVPAAAAHGSAIETLRPTSGGAAALLAQPSTAGAGPPENVLAKCAGIADNAARLECFDQAARAKK
jgi:hypothetical protein